MKIIILRGRTGSGKTTLLMNIKEKYGFETVEIDDIKREKYGKTTQCDPSIDLPEAGRRLKNLVDEGKNVVIEEAFLDIKHIDFLKEGFTGMDEHNIIYIQLYTSLQSALKRKQNILEPEVVKYWYDQKIDQINGELIFDTDKESPEEILNKLKTYFL